MLSYLDGMKKCVCELVILDDFWTLTDLRSLTLFSFHYLYLQLTEAAGTGCIVRVLTDRRRV